MIDVKDLKIELTMSDSMKVAGCHVLKRETYNKVHEALTELERLQNELANISVYSLDKETITMPKLQFDKFERELIALKKKCEYADKIFFYIGETLVDESKCHYAKGVAFEKIRKYVSQYHNKDWSDGK